MENNFVLDDCEGIVKAEPECEDPLYINIDEEEQRNLPGQLCRLCANSTPDDVIYIYGSVGEELSIARKINLSLPVMVKKTDPLPKQLCSSCVTKLNICHEFAETCLKAEEKLKALVKVKQFWSPSIIDEAKDVFPEEKLQHNIYSNHNTGKYALIQDSELAERTVCCPLCRDGKMRTCTEECNTEDEMCEVSFLSRSSETDDDISSGKSNTTEIVDTDAHDNSMKAENVICELKDDCGNSYFIGNNEEWWNGNSSFENAEVLVTTLSPSETEKEGNNVLVLNLEDAQASILCHLCGEAFSNVDQCLEHSLSHAEDSCYPCSLCGASLEGEQELTCHIEEHKNEEKKTAKQSRGRLSCHICGRRFNNERTLNEHSCNSNEVKQFRCAVCRKPYVSEERLAFHTRFHEGARPNYCTSCGKEFDNEGSLYYHTRMVHEGARPFCCEQCGKRFYSKARLEAHQRVHSGERPFECEICGRRFYDRETLKGHYVTHMPVKPYQCELCGACCGRKSMLTQHMRTHHSVDGQNVAKRVASLIHYYCKICDQTFTNSADVVNHRSTHWDSSTANNADGKRLLVCEFCGESFAAVATLGRHRKTEHPDDQPYVCSICQERSQTLYEARVHRRSHTSEENDETKDAGNTVKSESGGQENVKVFICEECGVSSVGRRKFAAHMKTHKTHLAYQCVTCGRHFSEKQRLLVHSRLHTGEKPYSCADCGKRFTQSSALYTHALLHTGEKPHKCDFCGKAFRIKADRDNHRRTHTGEKPYRCEYCQKQFRTGQVYYQHRMIHTGERRYPCDVCGKAFKRSHTLVVHKRIHTGEKPNICDVCGRGFRQRTDMKKHRALHGNTLFAEHIPAKQYLDVCTKLQS